MAGLKRIDVDERFGAHDVELHQVEQGCAAGEISTWVHQPYFVLYGLAILARCSSKTGRLSDLRASPPGSASLRPRHRSTTAANATSSAKSDSAMYDDQQTIQSITGDNPFDMKASLHARMIRLSIVAAAFLAVASPAAPSVPVGGALASAIASSHRAIVEKAFADWQAGRGSFYDLITEGGSVTIAGQSPNSGTFSKAAFLQYRAKPFAARFSTPILPTSWQVWAVDDQVLVRWDSKATACDGKPYANGYAYFITMKDGRATALTMFLDMGAFDDVWNRCQPATQHLENK